MLFYYSLKRKNVMVKSKILRKKLRAERKGEDPKGGGDKDRLNTNPNPTHWMNYLRTVGPHILTIYLLLHLCSFRAAFPESSIADWQHTPFNKYEL